VMGVFRGTHAAAEPAMDGAARRDMARGTADENDEVVQCVNVHKTYLLGIEGVAALRGVSLSIKRGEFLMLYGTSGGGKSTLLNLIGTIDKPTKGTVQVCGTRVSDKTPDAELALLRLKKLGFVFQTFNLIANLSALENVELPLTLHGALSPSERQERCKALLDSVGMSNRLWHLPAQLSGGEQQRVTIARAMANWPEILLLDEPTGDLDTANTDIVMRILVDLNRKHGITMVMVTHDNHLSAFAHRIVRMRDGKIHREEVHDPERRAAIIDQLFTAGLGAQDGVSGLREGANAAGGSADGVVRTLKSRGLREEDCSITKMRAPSEYATFSAQVVVGEEAPVTTPTSRGGGGGGEGEGEGAGEGAAAGGERRRFHETSSFVSPASP